MAGAFLKPFVILAVRISMFLQNLILCGCRQATVGDAVGAAAQGRAGPRHHRPALHERALGGREGAAHDFQWSACPHLFRVCLHRCPDPCLHAVSHLACLLTAERDDEPQ